MKKLLTVLSSFLIVTSSAVTLVSCSSTDKPSKLTEKEAAAKYDNKLLDGIKDMNLGRMDDLKPLQGKNDDNEFNWDYSHTKRKIFGKENWIDNGVADNSIGFYEVANRFFKGIKSLSFLDTQNPSFSWNDDNYRDWYGFDFSLKKDSSNNSQKTSQYVLTISSELKSVRVSFTSSENIEETLNTVVNNTHEINVKDGSKSAILTAIAKQYEESINANIDWKDNLDINNRIFVKKKDQVGYNHTINIDNNTGKGTIELYFKENVGTNYGGIVEQKINIEGYKPLSFDYKGNPYYYYDDRTSDQFENLNKIDDEYVNTNFDDQKHVIVVGLDGIRLDKFENDILEKSSVLNSYKTQGKNFQSFYSQAWESVYGWKGLLTGSISGDPVNIFKMISGAKNGDKLSVFANMMWTSFGTRVFTTSDAESGKENISQSFLNNSKYVDLEDYGNNWIKQDFTKKAIKSLDEKGLHLEDAKKVGDPGDIENTLPKSDLETKDQRLLDLNALKSYASYQNFKNYLSKAVPNLSFQYDTLEDNEGHSFNGFKNDANDKYYQSSLYKDTMKAYQYELEDLFNKYGRDSNYLIIVTTDHGRDEHDSSHQGYDLDPRNSWFFSNQDLTNYEGTQESLSQYTLKEIIFNFLKEGRADYEN